MADSRNKRFCSNECRHKAHRIIDDGSIVKLVKHSWWLRIESMLKNNPYGLGSINGPDDIARMMELYRIKARHQKAYNVLHNEWVLDKHGKPLRHLRPLLELEICHRYPNAKGGANTVMNLLIAPTRINRMLKDSVPHFEPGGQFNGIKTIQKERPVEKTLLKALSDQFGKESVQVALWQVKHVRFVDMMKRHALTSINTFDYPPLQGLLESELLRLKLYELKEGVTVLAEHLRMTSCGIDNELLAIGCFHALLKGDADSFLNRLSLLSSYLADNKTTPEGMHIDDLYPWYTRQLHHYMEHYFELDMNNTGACVAFYNSFFTFPPYDVEGKPVVISAFGVYSDKNQLLSPFNTQDSCFTGDEPMLFPL
uniref:hypothetical protein n=1 Tax=Photorhabdus sp. RM322S TaxID=3342825 RepID=UPI0036DA7F76